jgi:hypothetical protein
MYKDTWYVQSSQGDESSGLWIFPKTAQGPRKRCQSQKMANEQVETRERVGKRRGYRRLSGNKRFGFLFDWLRLGIALKEFGLHVSCVLVSISERQSLLHTWIGLVQVSENKPHNSCKFQPRPTVRGPFPAYLSSLRENGAQP